MFRALIPWSISILRGMHRKFSWKQCSFACLSYQLVMYFLMIHGDCPLLTWNDIEWYWSDISMHSHGFLLISISRMWFCVVDSIKSILHVVMIFNQDIHRKNPVIHMMKIVMGGWLPKGYLFCPYTCNYSYSFQVGDFIHHLHMYTCNVESLRTNS